MKNPWISALLAFLIVACAPREAVRLEATSPPPGRATTEVEPPPIAQTTPSSPESTAPPSTTEKPRRLPEEETRTEGASSDETDGDVARSDLLLEETPAEEVPRRPNPPGEEMARLIAQHIRGSGDQGGAPLPPPHDPYETNNFFALVRTADDLANTLPNYALSDDGKKIAFVRNDDSTLWIASSQGTHARKVFSANVDTHIAWDGTEEVLHTSGLFDLKFSPGGQFVYFQTDLAATSLGLVAFDERTKKVRFVTDANGYTIIKNCEREPSLNGYIVAYRHDYGILVAQATDLYFLLTPRGQRVGPIGPDGENVARFLHDRCGWGEPAPPVKNEAVPAKMRQVNTCGDVAFRHAPLQFLDGTVWQIFYAVRKEKAHVGFGRLQFDDYVDGAMSLEQADNALKECRDLEEDAGGFTQSTH